MLAVELLLGPSFERMLRIGGTSSHGDGTRDKSKYFHVIFS
jgi:hypothetical protein